MPDRPTQRQLRYLRALAQRNGQTFTYPRTKRDASKEIDRMKKCGSPTAADRTDRHREIRDTREAIHRGLAGGVAVRDHETVGYGSTAHWA